MSFARYARRPGALVILVMAVGSWAPPGALVLRVWAVRGLGRTAAWASSTFPRICSVARSF